MQRRQLFFLTFLAVGFLSMLLCSCRSRETRYVDQLRKRLPAYDSLTSVLVGRYSNHSLGAYTTVNPTERVFSSDGSEVSDPSIIDFCNENGISCIMIHSGSKATYGGAASATYFLSDNPNYRYIFDSKGTGHKEIFENTRVRIVPINDKWAFQYEKPNF